MDRCQSADSQHALPCITGLSRCAGEGIVQPLSKDGDQLSRRLHQYCPPAPGRGTFHAKHKGTFRKVMTCNVLSQAEAAYIAGLIDGEGTITLARKHRHENRQLAVTISSTEIGLLEFVKSATGVGKITNKRATKPHHTPSFSYAVYNRQALDLLTQIAGFLLSYKRRRAARILQDYLRLTPRNGKYPAGMLEEKAEFESAVLAMKANA